MKGFHKFDRHNFPAFVVLVVIIQDILPQRILAPCQENTTTTVSKVIKLIYQESSPSLDILLSVPTFPVLGRFHAFSPIHTTSPQEILLHYKYNPTFLRIEH